MIKKRDFGTLGVGIRCPIIKKGDDIRKIVVNSVINFCKNNNFELRDKAVVCVTESIVARAQGNYATIDDIAQDVKKKFANVEKVGVVFPIYSRNRFAILLKGIARGCKKIILMLSYPSDEVGNSLLTYNELDEKKIDIQNDLLTLDQYRELFGYKKHEFTGIDYIEYYSKIIKDEKCDLEIIFSNKVETILKFTKNILTCDIHTRERTKKKLKIAGAEKVFGIDEILNSPINNSGYNEKFGLLGSNKATEESVKLFPHNAQDLVDNIQKDILKITKKHVEVMIYGDGAFKDPQGKIWELADPVVSPFYTSGLKGTPNELKIKYLADNNFKDLTGENLKSAIENSIKNKKNDLKGDMLSEGTTPRKITDLLGSLCDLISGSGDKGTPIVLIQGYFDNYIND